ncbi:MAG: flagellar biosynthetic protein FliO [Pirellulales bacterium]|nr:flagellar biosynthetic protein FliO [Pirellulales bacterium]
MTHLKTCSSLWRRRSADIVQFMFMLRTNRFIAVSILTAVWAAAAPAETTPAPPNWQDGHGASVYLGTNQPATSPAPSQPVSSPAPVQEPEPFTPSQVPIAAPVPSLKPTSNIQLAAHEEPATSASAPSRYLAPPSQQVNRAASSSDQPSVGGRKLVNFHLPTESIFTVVTALAVVVGAFLLFTWALRRSGKHPGLRNGLLPPEAVSVIGRVPLATRQFAQLLRVGNKLVLVAITPNGPTTLTEVNDTAEVDRIVGLCQQLDRHSTTKAFEQIFQQFSKEPASGFLGDEALPTTLSPAASAYRSQRGSARA